MIFGRRKNQTSGVGADSSSQKAAAFIEHDPWEDDRYMSLATNASNWRLAFKVVAGLLAISLFGNVTYMLQSKFVPVPIAYDELGHKVVVGPVTDAKPIDSERAIRSEIEEFFESVRSVSSDNALQKRRMRWVQYHLPENSQCALTVQEFYKQRNPFDTAAAVKYTVEVSPALRQTKNTYHVEWVETQRNLNGEIIDSARWKAVFTYDLSPPETLEGIRANPFGLLCRELSWAPLRK